MKNAQLKCICILVLMLVSHLLFAQSIEEKKITAEYNNKPLKTFLDDLQTEHSLKVFYKDVWIAPYKINQRFNQTPLPQALNRVFYNHELTYELFQNDGIVIFRKVADTRAAFDDYLQTLVIGNPMNLGRYKKAKLLGRVLDGKDGEPLTGAVIFNNKLQIGTTTDGNGNFELDLPTGDHRLDISYIGFERSSVEIRLIENGSADFQLFEESHSIGEVTVLGNSSDVPRAQMSMVKMSSKELKQLPALMGEVDVLKGLSMLAGVQTVSELASGFNVRGGNTDQNLILLNGSPVFNSSHLLGFMSLINPDVVEDVRLFKGGMPVKYGERVASVMEVEFKEGNNQHLQASGGIGTLSSRLTLDGPITKDKKLSFIAGGRASYSDWMLKKLPDADLNQSTANFYDISGKLSYKFNAHNKLSVMAYTSNDEFSTSSQSLTEYGSILANLKLNNRLSEQLFGELQLAHSKYDYRLSDMANGKPAEAYFLDNAIQYNSGAYNFKWHSKEARHNVDFGFKFIYNKIQPGTVSPQHSETLIIPQQLNDEKMLEWAGYIGDEFEISPTLSVIAGIRYTAFKNIGTPVVYIYDPNKPMEPGNVIDSLQFASNEASASYNGIEPRFTLSYDAGTHTSLKLNYQRNYQYVFQLSNNAVISPAETWKASDYHLKPLIADQFAVGVENNSLLKHSEFSAEVYYKNLQNLIEYKNGAQLIMNDHVETALIPTQGYSYGIELSVRKNMGRLTGYASYVYSRTMRKNESPFENENFWSGDYYPSIYDKPHDLSLTGTYNISRRWKLSGNFVLISGRPTTLPELKYRFEKETLIYYSDRNKYRMPLYHRMDLSITFAENLRKKRMWKGSWTLSVYNLYGRNNPYSIYYKKSIPGEDNNFRSHSLYQLSVIGIPVPSLTYNFRF